MWGCVQLLFVLFSSINKSTHTLRSNFISTFWTENVVVQLKLFFKSWNFEGSSTGSGNDIQFNKIERKLQETQIDSNKIDITVHAAYHIAYSKRTHSAYSIQWRKWEHSLCEWVCVCVIGNRIECTFINWKWMEKATFVLRLLRLLLLLPLVIPNGFWGLHCWKLQTLFVVTVISQSVLYNCKSNKNDQNLSSFQITFVCECACVWVEFHLAAI